MKILQHRDYESTAKLVICFNIQENTQRNNEIYRKKRKYSQNRKFRNAETTDMQKH